MILTCFELSPETSNMVRSLGQGSDGIIRLDSKAWKSSLFNIPAQTSAFSIPIPYKVSSLCSLIGVMKNSSEANTPKSQYLSQRSKAYLSSYQLYSSTGALIPPQPVSLTTDINEAFNYTKMAFMASNNLTQIPSLLSWQSYKSEAHPSSRTDLASDDSSFCLGLNLESFNNSGLLGSYNSAQNSLILNLTFSQPTQSSLDFILIGLHDSLTEIYQNGTMSVII